MIIVLKNQISENKYNAILKRIAKAGLKTHISKGTQRTIIGLIGNEQKIQPEQLLAMPGVEKVMPVLAPYKLVSREFKQESSILDIKGLKIGGAELVVMAGPCSIESEEQLMEAAEGVAKAGAQILRGGAFKPRTSPYSFQGMGEKGLQLLQQAGEKFGMKTITEVMDTKDVALVCKYADITQIGARNMQNFNLLKAVGKTDTPVMLKRGMSATLLEFLMSAEYIMSEGNENVILCERGIRTFVEYTRNTLDLNIVPKIKQVSHLPIIVDPSHGTGDTALITPMAMASVAAGADGLMIEVHPHPENAVSDGDQSFRPDHFQLLMDNVAPVAEAVRRKLGNGGI